MTWVHISCGSCEGYSLRAHKLGEGWNFINAYYFHKKKSEVVFVPNAVKHSIHQGTPFPGGNVPHCFGGLLSSSPSMTSSALEGLVRISNFSHVSPSLGLPLE